MGMGQVSKLHNKPFNPIARENSALRVNGERYALRNPGSHCQGSE